MNEKERENEKVLSLATAPVPKAILKNAVPAILANLLMSISQIIPTI